MSSRWRLQAVVALVLTLAPGVMGCSRFNQLPDRQRTNLPASMDLPASGSSPAPASAIVASAPPAESGSTPSAPPSTKSQAGESQVDTPGNAVPSVRQRVDLLVRGLFSGKTNWGADRLGSCDVTDIPQGGVAVDVHFNEDQSFNWRLEDADIRARMIGAYQTLFALGPEVSLVTLGAFLPPPETNDPPQLVFATRMTSDKGRTVDWANALTIGLDRIWQVLYSSFTSPTAAPARGLYIPPPDRVNLGPLETSPVR